MRKLLISAAYGLLIALMLLYVAMLVLHVNGKHLHGQQIGLLYGIDAAIFLLATIILRSDYDRYFLR